jgi:hypothetical protein
MGLRRQLKKLIFNKRWINVTAVFPAYEVTGAGSHALRMKLTIQTINQMPDALRMLVETLSPKQPRPIVNVDEFAAGTSQQGADAIKALFDRYGSDKGGSHQYHKIYSTILSKPDAVTKVLEIGLGTNNTDVLSNMGPKGQPGASLRAFRDYCVNTQVFGADFDKRVLFEEDRIKTYYVDQTKFATLQELGDKIGSGFDLMIDDGLHAPNANVYSLTLFLGLLKPHGWAVIEDISETTLDQWHIVSAILPDHFKPQIVKCGSGCSPSYVFLVQNCVKS